MISRDKSHVVSNGEGCSTRVAMYASSALAWSGRLLAAALAVGLLAGTATQAYGQGATGGTITQDGNYWIHTFTTNSASGTTNFVITSKIVDVSYLIVGGGGGGGGKASGTAGCGGGGGGDFITNSTPIAQLGPQTITIRVGAGGGGGANTSDDSNGMNGFPSSIVASFSSAAPSRGQRRGSASQRAMPTARDGPGLPGLQ